jgi:hypothetical protein
MALKDDYFVTDVVGIVLGDDSATRDYLATYFVAGSSYTLGSIKIKMRKFGTPTFNITCEVRSLSTNAPGSVLGTSSTTIAASTLSTSDGDFDFTGFSLALTGSTGYFVTLHAATEGTSANNVSWRAGDGSYPGFSMTQKGSVVPAWTAQANYTAMFQTYTADAVPTITNAAAHYAMLRAAD